MKYSLLLILTFVTTVTAANAGSIDFTTDTYNFKRFPDQMEIIVSNHEEELEQYLGKSLECRLVELTFNNLKTPGVFRSGEYNLTLTAECNKSFKNFNMEVTLGYSLGEPIALKISYTTDGKFVEKVIGDEDTEE